MATGVKSRDDDRQISKQELEVLEDAMKSKKFRDLLAEYCEEVRDPANQAIYQKEMTQLEKERGYDVTFINPKGGYVIKTSVAGDRKAFINICSNENVGKPSYKVKEVDGSRGMDWQIPYSLIPPRDDFDMKKERCVIYDVVFHPDTLRMAGVNKRFRELVNRTALDALKNTYNIYLDCNNFRFPKSLYKGMSTPAVIRKEDPNYVPPSEDDTRDLSPEILEKLYPQSSYPQSGPPIYESESAQPSFESQLQKNIYSQKDKSMNHNTEYTTPRYIIKQQKDVDLQDYTFDKNNKRYSAIPSKIIVEINLPLLSSTKDCDLNVQEKALTLVSEKPAKYKLNIKLPYSVNEQCGNAQFDKTNHILRVSLPVMCKTVNVDFLNTKVDSTVDSEEFSGLQSDEDIQKKIVTEISSSPNVSEPSTPMILEDKKQESFLNSSIGYTLPQYTHNVLDDMVAFTFHVKNTEPDSLALLCKDNRIHIKFTSVGSGFTPVHYSALIVFNEDVEFHNVSGEAWDNNVILQMELGNKVPQSYQIGLDENSLVSENFNAPINIKNAGRILDNHYEGQNIEELDDCKLPLIEVMNLGTETNIVVTSNNLHQIDEINEMHSPTSRKEQETHWNDVNENNAKGILRKPMRIARSLSESSVEVASSMDYFSSDCIPEESSLKKTVRFNDVIARQFYRYNSSIEGQKKKNQRKKSKKRSQDRRKSESEAEDDCTDMNKTKIKSGTKHRRDSGLADTSDAESEFKSSVDSVESPVFKNQSENINFGSDLFDQSPDSFEQTANLNIVNDTKGKDGEEAIIWESDSKTSDIEGTSNNKSKFSKNKSSSMTYADIKHNTEFYNPDKLNKGQYLEVKFKNDLIFDLDM